MSSRTPGPAAPHAPPFLFVGSSLCLDLVNTEIVADGARLDLLPDFASFLRWLVEAKALSQKVARTAGARWPGAAATLAQVKTLRAVLRRTAEVITAGELVPAAALNALNPHLARSPARAELARAVAGNVVKRFRLTLTEPVDLLAPIAESAADLLSAADYTLVRKCANPACILFFYDRTKNHRRRWCSMGGCGNRAKVAAHRARQRKIAARASSVPPPAKRGRR